jgi:hypothetical protein
MDLWANGLVAASDTALRYLPFMKAGSVGPLSLELQAAGDSYPSLPKISPDERKSLMEATPDLYIPPDVSSLTGNLMAKAQQQKAYYGFYADRVQPGYINNLAAMTGSTIGQLTDPALLLGGGAAGKGLSLVADGIASKFLAENATNAILGSAAGRTAYQITKNMVQGGVIGGGAQIAQTPIDIALQKEQNHPVDWLNAEQNVGKAIGYGSVLGGGLGAIGFVGKSFFDKFRDQANITPEEEATVSNNYKPWTQESDSVAREDVQGQAFNGIDPDVNHILTQGEHDSAQRLMESLQQNNIDPTELSGKLEQGNQQINSDLTDINDDPEDTGKMQATATLLNHDIVTNPDQVIDKAAAQSELENGLPEKTRNYNADNENAMDDVIPDKAVESARVTQQNLYDDMMDGKKPAGTIPKEVIQRINTDNKIKKAEDNLATNKKLFSKTNLKKHSDLVDHYTQKIKDLKASKKPFIKPDDEISNLEPTLFDEYGNAIKGFDSLPEYERMKTLSQKSNRARNLVTRLHTSSPEFLKKTYKNAKNNALVNAFDHHTKMKSLLKQVRGETRPVSMQDIQKYVKHLDGTTTPKLEGYEQSLPPEEAKTTQEYLNDTTNEDIKNRLDSLNDPELIKQYRDAEKFVKNQGAYKNMVEDMRKCILGKF